MTASSMKAKIEAAMVAAGLTVGEGPYNQLLALCQGIIDEIHANAVVNVGIHVTTSTDAGQTDSTGTIS